MGGVLHNFQLRRVLRRDGVAIYDGEHGGVHGLPQRRVEAVVRAPQRRVADRVARAAQRGGTISWGSQNTFDRHETRSLSCLHTASLSPRQALGSKVQRSFLYCQTQH